MQRKPVLTSGENRTSPPKQRRGKFDWEYERCFMDATIASPTTCSTCGQEPIHPNPRPCGCSFYRNSKLVCRFCAIGFDLLIKRTSRLPTRWTTEEIRDLLDLLDRGRKVRDG